MQQTRKTPNTLARTRIWYVLILLLSAVVLVRVFHLQVIQHDYYKTAAEAGQMREYEIPASRGVIEAHNGDSVVPLVLNESRYIVFVDPLHIEDIDDAAEQLVSVLGAQDKAEVEQKMAADNRYQVIQRNVTKTVVENIEELELPGVGIREEPQRTYPHGSLAAHILGFVNNDGEGVYGIEQALDDELVGTPGQLRAVTDTRGIPLAANPENTLIEPQEGRRTRLTIDVSLQRQLEDALEHGLERARSESGGALVIDANSGAIKAMANYPTFDPSRFYEVSNDESDVFANRLVTSPMEIGSIMKPLTLAAALNEGAVRRDTTYYDPDRFTVDGATIRNVEESSGVGERNMEDILRLSLNTGATWLLKQMGGGDEINETARTTWHHYMTERFFFDKPTGIEQGYEVAGDIPDPFDGYGLNIQYANTAFGQGMTTTPLHAAAALSAVINQGTYYQPRLVDAQSDNEGAMQPKDPVAVRKDVVSPSVSADIRRLMEGAFAQNYRSYGLNNLRTGFTIGGKTGTAEVPHPEGGYYEDRFNGTFFGYVSGDDSTYVIMVRVDEPRIGGYAGSTAAGPIFVDIATTLIDSFGMQPRVN